MFPGEAPADGYVAPFGTDNPNTSDNVPPGYVSPEASNASAPEVPTLDTNTFVDDKGFTSPETGFGPNGPQAKAPGGVSSRGCIRRRLSGPSERQFRGFHRLRSLRCPRLRQGRSCLPRFRNHPLLLVLCVVRATAPLRMFPSILPRESPDDLRTATASRSTTPWKRQGTSTRTSESQFAGQRRTIALCRAGGSFPMMLYHPRGEERISVPGTKERTSYGTVETFGEQWEIISRRGDERCGVGRSLSGRLAQTPRDGHQGGKRNLAEGAGPPPDASSGSLCGLPHFGPRRAEQAPYGDARGSEANTDGTRRGDRLFVPPSKADSNVAKAGLV